MGSPSSRLFHEILGSRAIRTTVKSLELLYDYANLIQSSNVITDIRAVFDDEADHVIGAIVSFTLRMSYQNGNSAHSLSLAMDAEDVRKLQEQCRRALKKAETARTQFSGRAALRHGLRSQESSNDDCLSKSNSGPAVRSLAHTS